MKYKISDSPLKLKEYGRNIQSMVEYAKTVESKDTRTKIIYTIVRIMGNLNPAIKEIPDYKEKLWDHVHLIGDFELDIDSPYPVPAREEFIDKKVPKMEYYRIKPRFRQYGINIELMVQNAIRMEGQKQKLYINLIANTMKQFLISQNRGTPEDLIAMHITEISGGKLKVSSGDIVLSKTPLVAPLKNNSGSAQSNYKKNRNNNNNRSKAGRKNRRKKR